MFARWFKGARERVPTLRPVSYTHLPISGINLAILLRQSKRPRVALPALAILLAVGLLLAWWLNHTAKVQWAREQALPQIAKLIHGDGDNTGAAYALAVQAERYIPHDPVLVKLWPAISWSTAITTLSLIHI